MQEWLVKFRILKSDRRKFVILDKISGIIPHNRVCLLLGPPGSGKSTLLQALAGKLDAPDLQVGCPRTMSSTLPFPLSEVQFRRLPPSLMKSSSSFVPSQDIPETCVSRE